MSRIINQISNHPYVLVYLTLNLYIIWLAVYLFYKFRKGYGLKELPIGNAIILNWSKYLVDPEQAKKGERKGLVSYAILCTISAIVTSLLMVGLLNIYFS